MNFYTIYFTILQTNMENAVKLFLNQFESNINFQYSCFDRVVIRGYIHKLYTAGGIVIFLRALGFHKLSDGIMRIFTDQFNAHIKKEAEANDIPILWWPSVDGGKDGAKSEYVSKHYARKWNGLGNHVFCILTDTERASSFTVKTVQSKQAGHKPFRKLFKARKVVKHYYIYFHDELLGGRCFLKICSYLPFNCEFYFNGHNAIKVQLDEEGIAYRMKDNAFTVVENPKRLQEIAESITGRQVQDRIDYWMNRFFRFDKGKYSTRSKHLQHQWYMNQTEVCSNVIFKSARFATNLFERLMDKFVRFGSPDSLSQVFDKRRLPEKSKSTRRLFDHNVCIKHWLFGNSIKQYNKVGYYIRTETTINKPKSLGLNKPVLYMQAYLWSGIGCNGRLFDCCADVDPSSLSQNTPDLFSKPILTPKGHKVAAPDLRKDRQLALLNELTRPKHAVFGFKTKHLMDALPHSFRNSAQIRYEVAKLTNRGIIQKKKGKSLYIVTAFGWKLIHLSITATMKFANPIISMPWKQEAKKLVEQPSEIEAGYQAINQGFNQLAQAFALS